MDTPVEAEVKYEISESEHEQSSELLLALGFFLEKTTRHEDHYIEYKKSELGGFDFERIRKQTRDTGAVDYLWNRKTHALDGSGNKIRLEELKDLTQEGFVNLLAQAPVGHPVMLKHRQDFTGKIGAFSTTVSLDSILIGGEQKYFVEAEIMTDRKHGHEAKGLCAKWLETHLHIDTAYEAPSYLNQYLLASAKIH